MGRRPAGTRKSFSQPVRQIVLMVGALGLSGAGAALALPSVLPIFEANPWLNGFILFVFVVGVLVCFWQVAQLIGSVRWIERFAAGTSGARRAAAPAMLAPLATLLREREESKRISASSARSILDSVATRIDEQREITRYIVNLLIFLGLLGTFYGLATTVPAVVDTIRSLAPGEGESGMAVFDRLMTGLDAQLSGMGVAFASSLLGLAGSLIVGLLELFAGHGQNRFYRELEDWLSSITSLGVEVDDGALGNAAGDRLVGTALTHLVNQIEAMNTQALQTEMGRVELDGTLTNVAYYLSRMTEAQASLPEALERMVNATERMEQQLTALAGRDDEELRMRLRSIDGQLVRITEEIAALRHAGPPPATSGNDSMGGWQSPSEG